MVGQILRDFKIGGIFPYYLSLLPGSAISINDVSHREMFFLWFNKQKQILAPMLSMSSGNGFVRIHLLGYWYRGGLTCSKTRDAFVRSKALAVLVWVKMLYGRWRPLLIKVQGNLCGREAVSYRFWKRLCIKFYADGLHETFQIFHDSQIGTCELP